MTILCDTPAKVNSDASTWPAWTDADRWELGPDGIPIAPFTTEDAEWWAEHSRDDEPSTLDDPGWGPTEADWLPDDERFDRQAAESEAESRLTAGYSC